MDLLGPILEVLKWFGDLTWRYLDHHRKLEENVNDLRRKLNDLIIRKEDVESRKNVELRCRKVVKKEVEKWFDDVERMNALMQRIEQDLLAVSYFSRAGLGTLVCQSIAEVQEVYKHGWFPNGVAIDGPPAAGVTFQMTDLEGEADVKYQIWRYLLGSEVGMIGVCGMSGIGKTTIMKHINNQLVSESDRFDQVIWVSVSKEFNLVKLQEDIACALDYHLPKNELEWPTALMKILETKRFMMILDDVWERFSLFNVGIPAPTFVNGSKLVLTSRSSEVCKSMGCKVLKVQPLSQDESLNLFLKHVGQDVVQVPCLEETIKHIVQQCGGLPLAIVIIAGSMKGVDDDLEWRNVLNELRERVKSVKGMDIEIFECLKFSYDRLRDSKIQNCFLYCSLYPEDYPIKMKELMEKWIDEGLLDEFETRQAMHYRGHSILKKLENNFLLEKANNEDEVKMHDVLRDMALFIIKSVGHQFMVKSGLQLKKLPGERQWIPNLEKVSLMDNKISAIPADISPKCHSLSTLLLQENYTLESISESFFDYMFGLKILDLSNTGILDLPTSVSNLVNLVALVLRNCDKLRHVCSLAKLRALRKLDLFNTDIKEVPQGIEKLANLSYLGLYSNDLTELPSGVLPMFSRLQYLATMLLNIAGEEVAKLSELEIVSGSFFELQDFENYAKCISGQWPNHYRLTVGSTRPDYFDYDDWFPCFENPELYEELCFINCQIGRGEDLLILPNNLTTLSIEECHEFKSLSSLCSLHEVNELQTCSIWQCEGIDCVIDLSLSSCNSLQKLEKLSLGDLCNLSELVRPEAAVLTTSQAQTPAAAMFSYLKTLCLWSCSSMKNLFSLEILQCFQKLEQIQVVNCKQMEEIVAASSGGEAATTNSSKATSILPKLRELSLQYLPKLKNICNSGIKISANCLEHLSIMDCSMRKKIPLSLPLLENGQPFAPPSLGRITVGSREWWESVEWEDAKAKDALSPFVCVG